MDNMQYVRLLTFIFWIQGTVCQCPATVHRDIKGFGADCRYRCNCKDNAQCDYVTGECPNGCLFGWMGPGCQYRNVATTWSRAGQNYAAPNTEDWAKEAVDGDKNTCSQTGPTGQPDDTAQQWWEVELSTEFYIVGLVIKIQESEKAKFRGYSVEIGNTTSSLDICYKHGPNADGEVVMNVNCIKSIVGNIVKIKLAENEAPPLILCEVEIYGGRLVSFNKVTSMESVLNWIGYWNSSYAVDGRPMLDSRDDQNVELSRTCAATRDYERDNMKWWSVSLGTVVDIQGINYFGRLGGIGQSSFYTIRVDNLSVFTDSNPSTSDDVYDPKSTNFTVPVPGSVVRVQRRASILLFCEFEVFAECPLGRCGIECNEPCMCSSQTTGHDKIQGICPYGCSGRWSGQDRKCNIECPDTKWGTYCNNTCGNCKNNDLCTAYDGTCPNSCKPGWIPPLCVQECGHCKNNDLCIAYDGTCPDSCQPGWIPPLCVQECDDGYFGEDCNRTCGNCKTELGECNKENGECLSGCKLGYKPPLCIDKCDPGWYGDGCGNVCGKCRNGTICNQVTGNCPNKCEAGYQGQSCIQAISCAKQHDVQGPSFAVGIIVGVVSALGFVGLAGTVVWVILRRRIKEKDKHIYTNQECDGPTTDTPNYDDLDHSHANQGRGTYYSELHVYETGNDTS